MNYSDTGVRVSTGFKIKNYLPDIGIDAARQEILTGLRAHPKYISSKFFYDQQGSALFEEITRLEEYYPTRTEKSILATIIEDLNLDFTGFSIIELGSGDHSKIRLLLSRIPENELESVKYYPVDISQSAIEQAAGKLTEEFPVLEIEGIVADFISQLHMIPNAGKRMFCFFGSTIGNLNMNETQRFMKLLGDTMQQGDHFLLGLDMIKDPTILEKAYNDSRQITADFNKNILNVVNRLAGADFDPDGFDHLAFYNSGKNRIEMHLKAKEDMEVNIRTNGEKIHIRKGETIHTENSQKFGDHHIRLMGKWAGLRIKDIFTDINRWFSLVHYIKF